MRILGIECTATPVSCALWEDGKIKGEYFLNLKTVHSQTLMPMIESLLGLSDLSMRDIDAIAVTAGPGSFTGVRIGISAAKGLALPDGKPCIPVSALEAMAYGLAGTDCIVCAVMDARCNQVYNAVFSVEKGKVNRLCDDRALRISELEAEILQISQKNPEKTIFVVGDGTDLFYNSVEGSAIKAPEHLKWQRASCVCFAAQKQTAVSPEELLPVYLRLPQAERELRARQAINGKDD